MSVPLAFVIVTLDFVKVAVQSASQNGAVPARPGWSPGTMWAARVIAVGVLPKRVVPVLLA